MLVEIKLDKSTLPQDGQHVMWQTYDDINKEVWCDGIFDLKEEIFVLSDGNFIDAYMVIQWSAKI